MKVRIGSPEYYQLVEKLKVQLESIPQNEETEKLLLTSAAIMYHSDNELTEDQLIISKAESYRLIKVDGVFIYGME